MSEPVDVRPVRPFALARLAAADPQVETAGAVGLQWSDGENVVRLTLPRQAGNAADALAAEVAGQARVALSIRRLAEIVHEMTGKQVQLDHSGDGAAARITDPNDGGLLIVLGQMQWNFRATTRATAGISAARAGRGRSDGRRRRAWTLATPRGDQVGGDLAEWFVCAKKSKSSRTASSSRSSAFIPRPIGRIAGAAASRGRSPATSCLTSARPTMRRFVEDATQLLVEQFDYRRTEKPPKPATGGDADWLALVENAPSSLLKGGKNIDRRHRRRHRGGT
jgi:hypothetical protein